jgi:hypothetical protein
MVRWLLVGVALAALASPFVGVGVSRADQLEDAIACEASSCNGKAACWNWAESKVKRFMQLEARYRHPIPGWWCGQTAGVTIGRGG